MRLSSMAESVPLHELRALLEGGSERQAEAGELVFQEGSPPDGVWLVRQGTVELVKSFFGETHRLLYVSRGALVGEGALFGETARPVTARCVTRCRLRRLPAEHTVAFHARHPGASLALLRQLSGRSRQVEQILLEQLVQRNLELQLHTTRLETRARRRVRDLEESNRELGQLAWRDPLTGCNNRRAMEAILAQACREGSPMTFAMLDVDNFKFYNDNNGHPAGDVALQTLVKLLDDQLRNDDMLARYGGEEFCMLLRDVEPAAALHVCRRLAQRVADHGFPFEERQPLGNFTVSMGLAHFPNDASEPDSLIQVADGRLYEAKRAGRNRVVGGADAGL